MQGSSGLDVFPDDTSLRNHLSAFVGKKAYVIEISDPQGQPLGNHGDALMNAVFRRLLNSMGILETTIQAQADFFIVPPNGALLQQYRFPLYLEARLRAFPNMPLVIFPSSAYFVEVDPTFMFRGRKAETIWMLREKYSHDMLASNYGAELAGAGVSLVLDHDVVVSGHRYVPQILGSTSEREYTLLAPRIDFESKSQFQSMSPDLDLSESGCSMVDQLQILGSRAFNRIPESAFKTSMARGLRASRIKKSNLEFLAGLSQVDRDCIGRDGRILVRDLSSKRYSTFKEYSRILNEARLVVTDRLHVGLPAAILGKEVILVEAGYHKLSGVYEQSLRRAGNVRLVRPT